MTMKITIPYYSDCHKGSALPNVRITKKFGTSYAAFVKTRTAPTTPAELAARELFVYRYDVFKRLYISSPRPNVYPLREAARTSYPVGYRTISGGGFASVIVATPGVTVVAPLFSAPPPPITTPSPMPC